jgi:hypothetical protein
MRFAAFVGVLLVAVPFDANAQTSPRDRALATELFQRGRDLLAQGRHAEACEALEASQELDPSGGTVLNLALCHELIGRTATAWSEFRAAVSFAKRDQRPDRLSFAEQHLAALEPRLVRLLVRVDAADKDLAVVRNGSPWPRAAWGAPVPIDPGHQVIEARGSAAAPFRTELDLVNEGEMREVRVPALVTPTASAPARGSVAVAAPAKTSPLVYGLGIGAVGATLVGAVAGIRAIQKRQDSDEIGCTAFECSRQAVRVNDDAKTAADVATVAFAVAIAAAGTAIVLAVIAPRSSHAAARGFEAHF